LQRVQGVAQEQAVMVREMHYFVASVKNIRAEG